MNVFSALVGELKGVLGKGFLLAGVIPAAVFTAGLRWFASRKPLATTFDELSPLLAEDTGDALSQIVAFGAITLLLGLVFFAARSAILDFVQRLPGRPLRWLRELLQRRQAIRRQRILHRTAQLDHAMTVLRWLAKGEFEQPEYLPPHRRPLADDEMKRRSAEGRSAFADSLPPAGAAPMPPPAPLAELIVEGVTVLYDKTFEKPSDETLAKERSRWKMLLQRHRAQDVVRLLAAHLQRQWAIPRQRFEDFPEDAHILPTTLGTRAAALDDYARRRYGIGTSTLLSRLLPVLEDTERQALANGRLSLEVTVNLGAAFALLAPAAVARNLYEVWPWRAPAEWSLAGLWAAADARTLLFVAVPILLAALLYRAAIFTHGALEEKVVRAVDLERLDLIEALGFERPTSVGEEKETWRELNRFFVQGLELDRERPVRPKT